MQKKIATQNLAGEKRARVKEKSNLPILLNRCQVAEMLGIRPRGLYRVELAPDAKDGKGFPLFNINRLASISEALKKLHA
jgi:hypothetical protein